jgi:hypothetical protein
MAHVESPSTNWPGLTAERSEQKFLVSPKTASRLARTFDRMLCPHRYTGEGAALLPQAEDYTTTLYFDTPDWDLLREAQTETQSLKLRGREYYSLYPSLAQLATHPEQLVRFTPILWLEIKYKDGDRVEKRRIGLPKRRVPEFFIRGDITAELVELQKPTYGAAAGRVLDEVVRVCQRFSRPLRPACVVNYRRSAWQDEAATVRVTLDRSLCFFAVAANLWQSEVSPIRETLGPPTGRQSAHVLEIKTLGSVPNWLEELVNDARIVRTQYSKFVEACKSVQATP